MENCEIRKSISSLPNLKGNTQEEKYIIAFVGLPARGKSYISSKLAKFLSWVGYNSKVFSIGLYRRSLVGVNFNWKFFDEDNPETFIMKEKCILRVLDDMIQFLTSKGGRVGIIDGTNTRRERRKMIEEYIKFNLPNTKYKFMWIESVCTLDDVIERNILKNKLKSPDYKGWNEEEAVKDFRDRIKTYEKVYEHLSPEIDGEDTTYIQLINYNSEINIRNVKGFLQSKVLSYIINLNPGDKPLYFIRHGESDYNTKNMIGGDGPLSKNGENFAKALYNFLSNEEFVKEKKYKDECVIFTSTLKRNIQTAAELASLGKIHTFKCFDDLNVGLYDGMTYEEIKVKYPKDHDERNKDKLNYRYPRGESYRDLINRIEPLIYEIIRRQGPVIIIGHQATLRCLYGYIIHAPLEDIPYLDMPLNTVIRKLPQAFGVIEDRFYIDPETMQVSIVQQDNKNNLEDNLYNLPEIKDL